MKIERILLAATWLLLVAGIVWVVRGGTPGHASVSVWLLLAAFGILSLPLLGWLVYRVIRRGRE